MKKKDGPQIAEALRARLSHAGTAQTPRPPAASAAPVAPSPPTGSPVGLLAKLGDLHEAGVLTDEEFAAKKAELLKRL